VELKKMKYNMHLKYIAGILATVLLSACSVTVDVDDSTMMNVSVSSGEHAVTQIAMLSNGNKGFRVPTGQVELINGTYKLIYAGSDTEVIELKNYVDGSPSQALISLTHSPLSLEDKVYYAYQDVTVPGDGSVLINEKPLTKVYTLTMECNNTKWTTLVGDLRTAEVTGLPNAFCPATGKWSAKTMKSTVKFDAPVVGASTTTMKGQVLLPVMDTFPGGARLSINSKSYEMSLQTDNTITVTIK